MAWYEIVGIVILIIGALYMVASFPEIILIVGALIGIAAIGSAIDRREAIEGAPQGIICTDGIAFKNGGMFSADTRVADWDSWCMKP